MADCGCRPAQSGGMHRCAEHRRAYERQLVLWRRWMAWQRLRLLG